MQNPCPYELSLRFVDPWGFECLLKNVSDVVQEFIDDWQYGLAPVLVILGESGAELPYHNVFPPIDPAPIIGYTALQVGRERKRDLIRFEAKKGMLYYHKLETANLELLSRRPLGCAIAHCGVVSLFMSDLLNWRY